jgi:peptidyl-prolyl cis-trans isomerase D
MITWMQKHRKYLVITIWISTIAFVGAGFVGWGAYSYNRNRAGAVAVVGDRKITINELNNAYSNIYNYYQEQLKGGLTREKAKEMGLEKVALGQLINEALMLNYADELGLTTLDSEVEDALKNTKAFQQNGVFNKDQYYRVLRNIGTRAKDYEESLKKEITLKKLNNILKLAPTPLEVETFGASLFMQDKLATKIIYADTSKITINDDILKNFWEKRKKSYLTTKTYELSIIKIPVSFIQVDENESKEYYTKKRYGYTDKDGKILSYEDAKDRVIKDLQFKKGKRFALKKYLALKKGKIQPNDKMSVSVKQSLFPQDKLKTASVGDVLKPFKFKDGYIVAKVTKIDMPKPMSFEEAKERVKKDYLKIAKKEQLEKEAKKLAADLKGANNIGFVSRDDIKKIKGLNELEAVDFLNQVFNSSGKKGYKVFGNKAIVYKVLEQKLLDKNKLKTYDMLLKSNVKNAKLAEINQKLLSKLRQKYQIESFYKGQ